MKPLDPTKRENILDAVYRIVGRKGLAGVSIKEISMQANLGIGSIYTYFSGKEEVIEAAFFYAEHNITTMMFTGLDINAPVKKSLAKIYFNALKYRLKHYDEAVFIDQYMQSNYVQINLAKQFKEYEAQHLPLYSVIKKGQEEGILNNLPPFLMINYFLGVVRSTSNGMLQRVIPLNKMNITYSFNMAWRGLCI
ncbi:MAG: TetR/AcrR family transcriptional regulator [Puia sp.]|nr:TetR/AcrR family transcriptional regulator [Puia sp.]